MPFIDDLNASTTETDLSRRKALGMFTGGAFALAATGTTVTTVQFLSPNVLFEPSSRVLIGRPESIAVGTLLVLPEQRLYVLRTERGFFAMSAVCTHLGCITRHGTASEGISCPCHGSRFDLEGRVTDGPAPRPLDRKHVFLENGQLVVDIRKTVDADFVLEV